MLKVLIVIHSLTYTGSIFSAKRICRILMKEGYKVDIWSYHGGAFKKEFEEIGIDPQIIDEYSIDNKIIIEKIQEYDLLLANTIVTYKVYEVAKNIIPTIWYIRESQNLVYEFFLSDIKMYYALRHAEKLYTVSEYAKDFIIKNYNPHVNVVHNCIEDEEKKYLRSTQKENTVIKFLAIGTIEIRKAFDVFIKAYTTLTCGERRQCEVHLIGKPRDGQEEYTIPLMEMIKKETGVFYHGEIQERKYLLQLIVDSDVIVVPSIDESCSLVALEAAMMSKPLIISENVGAKYLVKPENGWIFKTGSIQSLRDVYREVLDKKQCLIEMGRRSKKIYLQTSTYEIYEKQILSMISENMCTDKLLYRMNHVFDMEMGKFQRKTELKIKYGFYGICFLPQNKIAIYAAGEVGQAFYQCCNELKYEVIAWVDKNWKKYKDHKKEMLPVEEISKLQKVSFDYVCIAVFKKEIADGIREDLLELGIKSEKIVWVKPGILRD